MNSYPKIFFAILIFVLVKNNLYPQEVIKDTTKNDSINLLRLQKKSEIDAPIFYKSKDSIIYQISNKSMDLFNQANIKYKKIDLKSGRINIDFDKGFLKSEGIAGKDSVDTNKTILVNTPILNDAGEEYKGTAIDYNFRTQQGSISMAKTATDGQFYYGEKIRRLDPETYLVKDGRFTTCDAEEPHFYFFSKEMKVLANEVLITRWVWLYFADVPFPIPLPFGVFPNQSGRRSGIIPPTFGEREGYGRYFSNFGYYWAISDYMDINFTGTFYTRGGYGLNSRFRYVSRYNYSGNVDLGYSNFHLGELSDKNYSEQKDYRISIQHSQQINPSSRFDANMTFVSSSYYNNNSTNINDFLNNQITSNATYYKNWESSGNSISLSYNRVQNLSSGDIQEVLPSISFTMQQFYPFKKSIKEKSKAGESIEDKWYEQVAVNYSSQLLNRRNNIQSKFDTRAGINHDASIFLSSRIGYFNLSPRISVNSKWYLKQIERHSLLSFAGGDSIITNDIDKFGTVTTFDMGISLNTKLYGMYRPNLFGITAIRHTITPSIGYNFRPDYSKPFWNYYKRYTDAKGNEIPYNIFEREVFGGASAGEQQSMSLNISNNLEMKLSNNPKDTTIEQKKIQLLNFDLGLAYNFAADSLKLSDLRTNFYTNIGSFLSIGGSANFVFYKYVDGIGLVNKFLLSEGLGLARMTSFNLSLSTSITSDLFKSDEKGKDTVKSTGLEKSLYEQIKEQEKGVNYSIPWNLSLNYSYSVSQFNPKQIIKYSNIGVLFGFSLTKSWKISVSGNYDIFEKQLSAPIIRISRDLHCWDMNFEWYPIGSYRGFRFTIRAKAPQLQDLKVEKSGGVFSR